MLCAHTHSPAKHSNLCLHLHSILLALIPFDTKFCTPQQTLFYTHCAKFTFTDTTFSIFCRDLSGNNISGTVPVAWVSFTLGIQIFLQPGNPHLCGKPSGMFYCAVPPGCQFTADNANCTCGTYTPIPCPAGKMPATAPGKRLILLLNLILLSDLLSDAMNF